MSEMTIEARDENLYKLFDFIHCEIGPYCSKNCLLQIDIAVEEIFINICHYAYKPEKGNVTVRCVYELSRIILTFTDSGRQYNPLAKQDPDTSLDVDKRQIGGLGIFIVKNSMDACKYWYRDLKNNFEMTKWVL